MQLPQRIALVHDWLTGMRGGEKVLEVFCELFPEAPVFTLVAIPDKLSATLASRRIVTSFLQRIPGIERRYRHFLPLFPLAIERMDLRGYDLVLSSSHAVAKGVRPDKHALHISYIHTPMRYVWDMFDQYFNAASTGSVALAVIRLIAARIRRWDVRSCSRVHHFIANSAYIADRVVRHYHRDATVIHPPVSVERFTIGAGSGKGFLVVSALVPYKRVDLAIEAANALGEELRIIGDGPEASKLRAMAGPTVRFDGWVSDEEIAAAYSSCCALLFPGEEDFGIVPVEAMASGRPVIAYGRGGATETVRDGQTGLLFNEQTTASLIAAMQRFDRHTFDAAAIRRHAEGFSRERFADEIRQFVTHAWQEWRLTAHAVSE
ncbi:MAG: glycosyltransferase [Bacteroidia bacterium]|nr:glycosyltransferase [Bacteroidia bacterium]